jgi:hypothetical protein
MVSFALVN